MSYTFGFGSTDGSISTGGIFHSSFQSAMMLLVSSYVSLYCVGSHYWYGSFFT
jgi:hypothetical protein